MFLLSGLQIACFLLAAVPDRSFLVLHHVHNSSNRVNNFVVNDDVVLQLVFLVLVLSKRIVFVVVEKYLQIEVHVDDKVPCEVEWADYQPGDDKSDGV